MALSELKATFNSIGVELKCRLFIYFRRLGLWACTRLFTVCRNAKPQTQRKPRVEAKHSKGRQHRKPPSPAAAKQNMRNCGVVGRLHAEKLNQKYFTQLKCLSGRPHRSGMRRTGRQTAEGVKQRKGRLLDEEPKNM